MEHTQPMQFNNVNPALFSGQDVFAELVEKSEGMPSVKQQEVKDMADMLVALGAFSKDDMAEDARYILENVASVRAKRAKVVAFNNPSEAQRLEASAVKLRSPNVDEQYVRRVALIEMGMHLKAKLRNVDHMESELDPVRLHQFKRGLIAAHKTLPPEIGSYEDRDLMAKMAFVQELRAADNNVDLAVRNFYVAQTHQAERGHWHDVPIDRAIGPDADEIKVNEPQTPDALADWVQREEDRERQERIESNKIIQNMPLLAAEYLKPKEYAAFRVMVDNEHLMDWKVQENGKIHLMPKTLNAEDKENTLAKILKRELDYKHNMGASYLIADTIKKMNTLILERGDQDIVPSEKAKDRIGKTTQELLADPAVKAIKQKGKGKGIE